MDVWITILHFLVCLYLCSCKCEVLMYTLLSAFVCLLDVWNTILHCLVNLHLCLQDV